MKKLKAALILLLALMMSLCLFACGGGEEEPPTGGGENPPQQGDDPTPPDEGGDDDESEYRKIELDPGTINLTDSDGQAKLDQALAEVTVYATDYEGEEYEFHLSDCNYTSNVTLHEVGEYSFDVALKSDDSVKATLTVRIDHDWKTESSTTQVCQYDQCKARRNTQAEDVIIHYGTFHQGTGATLPSGFWAEDQVYTNNKADTSIVKPFGEVDGLEVPTLTAGQLEPGMTITIRGRAMTTSGETGPWAHENQNWNSPTIGIADRYNMYQNPANLTEYKGGVSVLVRQEGWVLYNGIGDTDETNRLGGIIGGKGENAGGWKNYGSHDEATADTNPGTGQAGYVPGVIPTDWSNIGDWWVYSTGATFPSLLNYAYQTTEDGKPDLSNATEYEYSWNYREDGVIEITYNYIVGGTTSTLKSYIKVPDSSVGYYDTIIHGDYNDMSITESTVITKRTPKAFRYNGLKSGANSVYAENKPFDAATLDVEAQYEQTGETWNTLQVANSQVYYYTGSLSYSELGANEEVLNSTDSENWVCLGTNNALKAGAFYKIHIVKGGKTFVQLLPENAFTVLANKVGSAEGADVTVDDVLFANNGKLGDFTFSVADSKILLTLDGGYVQALSEQQVSALAAGNATKYVALRLNGAALGDAFTAANVSVKKDGTAVPSKAVVEGDDLYLVIALTEGGKYTVSGAQATDIVLDLTNLKGFKLSSKIKGTLSLNKGGELTLTYTVPAGTAKEQLTISVNGSPYDLSYDVGAEGEDLGLFKLLSATLSGTTLSVKIKAPAADLNNYAAINIELSLSGANADTIVDVVDYDMTFEEADGYVAGGNGAYAFVQKSGTLSVATAFANEKLGNGVIKGRFTLNANNGNLDNFKKYGVLTVDYEVVDGVLNLLGAPSYVTGLVRILGTYGDDRDADKGAYVLINVDVTALELTGDYYFNFVDGLFNAKEAPAKILKVSGTKISEENVTGNPEIISTAAGSCYEEGLYAWAVKSGDDVIFYANAAAAGGEHVDENSDGVCDLCGGTIGENLSVKPSANWFPAGGIRQNINEGDVFTFTGTYADDIAEAGFGSVLAIMIEEAEGEGWDNIQNDEKTNGTWHTTQDGYAYWTNFNWGNMETAGEDSTKANRWPYAPDYAEYDHAADGYERFTSSIITEEHPYNTANGWVNAYGTAVDATNFDAAKQGGSFRFIVIRENGVITTTAQLWGPDMNAYHSVPFFEYQTKITVDPDAGRYTVYLMGKQQIGNVVHLVDDKITFTQSRLTNSAIDSVTSADVEGHTAPAGIQYANSVNGTNAVVTATGVAGAEGQTHYISFKVNFKQALVETTVASLVNAQGQAIANAVCKLAASRDSLEVYLPIADGMQEVYINFSNYEASTMQANIKVDLTNLSVSDISATVSGDVNVGAGTFTIQYQGGVQATDSIKIGGTSKTLTELKTQADFGNGLQAQAGDVTDGSVTVTFTKAAADLTKNVVAPELRLERNGALLYLTTLVDALKATGTALEQTAWYAIASGNTLTLVTNGVKSADSLKLSANAGKKTTDLSLLEPSDLAFTVSGGAVVFNGSSALSTHSTAKYSESGETYLVAIVIDLSGFGVADNVAYGYALEEENANHYYTVAAEAARTIAEASKASGEKTDVSTASCTTDGIKAYTVGAGDSATFYYGIEFTKGEHSFPADGGECTVCHEVTGWKKDIEVGVKGTPSDASSFITTRDNGAGQAYDPADTEKFGAIVKGQTLVMSGELVAATTGGGWTNMNGIVFNLGGIWLRDDAFIDANDAVSKNWATQITSDVNGEATVWEKVVALRASAQMVLTYDWTIADKITMTLVVTGSNGDVYTQVYVITATEGNALPDIYAIGLAPEYGWFKGTITVTADKDVVSAEDCNQWLRAPGTAEPDPTYSENTNPDAENPVNLPSTGYQATAPAYIYKLEKGHKVVFSGTHTTDSDFAYNSIVGYLWTGTAPDGGFCANHSNTATVPYLRTEGQNYASWTTNQKNGNVKVTVDWTRYTDVIVWTYEMEKDGTTASVEYLFQVDASKDHYNVGLGSDACASVINKIENTTGTPGGPFTITENELTGTLSKGTTNHIVKGEKIVFTGTHTCGSTNGWDSLNLAISAGSFLNGPTVRSDRWVDGAGDPTGTEPQRIFNQNGYKITCDPTSSDAAWDTNLVTKENGNVTVTLDWTGDNLVITVHYGDTSSWYQCVYTVEYEGATNYWFVLGGNATYSLTATVTGRN